MSKLDELRASARARNAEQSESLKQLVELEKEAPALPEQVQGRIKLCREWYKRTGKIAPGIAILHSEWFPEGKE